MLKISKFLNSANKLDKPVIKIIKDVLGITDDEIEPKQVWSTGRTFYLDSKKIEIGHKERELKQKLERAFPKMKVYIELNRYRGNVDLEPK